MADEIRLNVNLTTNSGVTYKPGQVKVDQTNQLHSDKVHKIGTSEENVTFADLTAEGVMILQNLDATNFVEYGQDDGGTMKELGKLLPGDIPHITRLADGETLRMKADTAECQVRIICLDT